MSGLHQADLLRRMMGILSRRSPSRAIASSEEAQKAEVAALVRAVAKYAPRDRLEEWWQQFEDALLSRMKTHSWPIQSEIEAAAKSIAGNRAAIGNAVENVIELAAQWYAEHRTPFPSSNTPETTRALIERGVIGSLREARWRGFATGAEDTRKALVEPMFAAEFEHHVEVLARLKRVEPGDIWADEASALGYDASQRR
jgi:hypothetical protein